MELLADVPTLVGGYDGDKKLDNDVIYQVPILKKTFLCVNDGVGK
jgi:hypothetical protein